MAPKSVTFRRHDHLVSVLFGDLLSHSYNTTFSMFLDLVLLGFVTSGVAIHSYYMYPENQGPDIDVFPMVEESNATSEGLDPPDSDQWWSC